VADFPKIGGKFSLNQLNIFPTTESIMLYQKILFQTPGIVFSQKLSVICQAAAMHLQSATFQSQLKVAKVVLLLGGNISCMFSGGSRCLGISLFRFLEVLPKVSSCMFFLVSCWNRAQTQAGMHSGAL
jgi:hypothetical protein